MHSPAPPSSPEEVTTCEQCKVTSPLSKAFQTFRGGRRVRKLCPNCFREATRRLSIASLMGLALFGGIGIVMAALGPPGNPGWIILNFALMNVMVWMLIVPHEAGHALAARLSGYSVYRIVIGTGRRIGTLTVFDVPVEIHAIPLGGLTSFLARTAPVTRLRHIVVVVAGPLVHVTILWAALRFGADAWRSERVFEELAPVSALVVASVVGLIANLWPSRGGRTASDGARLLSLVFKRRPEFAETSRGGAAQRVGFLLLRERLSEAESAAKSALAEYPADYRLQILLSAALLNQHRYIEGRELLLDMLGQTAPDRSLEAIVRNNLAWANLNLADESLADEARAMSAAAYRLIPWEAYVVSTHGCVEAFYGDAVKAVSLLDQASILVEREKNRAATQSGLAMANARLGRRAESIAALAKAAKIDPDNHLLRIARERLAR